MKPLHYTASALALGLALMGNAQAVTTIPFWHSMEGELGKEVDSLAQRFNAENPDYKIVPTYKGNYEQNLSAGIAAFRTGNAPAILQVYEVGTATMMALPIPCMISNGMPEINHDSAIFQPPMKR